MKRKVENLVVDGINTKDYPDFADAFFGSGTWADTGEPLTEDELEQLATDDPELLYECIFDQLI